MNVLIVGGGIFVGRRLVESALARGHQVTIFNRGRHNENVPANVEILKGDRNSDLSALRLRSWDSVIDTCGYTPGSVRRVMDALDRDGVEHYSSCQVSRSTPSFRSQGVMKTSLSQSLRRNSE